MKTKNRKTDKIIFSSLMALCVVCSVFFIYYNQSFASSLGIIPYISSTSPSYSTVNSSALQVLKNTSGGTGKIFVYKTYSSFDAVVGLIVVSNNWNLLVAYPTNSTYVRYVYTIGTSVNQNTAANSSYNVSYHGYYYNQTLYNQASYSSYGAVDSSLYFTSLDAFLDACDVHFGYATPTPTPTSTPAPATPTPDPGGTIPTPSGDYGSFFQRMASDAQSAFNALYLSWTNANNRFYSSIFFIGLPLLITVFGIVAGIILGDDD